MGEHLFVWAGDSTSLQALFRAKSNVVGNAGLDFGDLFFSETTKGGTEDVRRKTENALSKGSNTTILRVEASNENDGV